MCKEKRRRGERKGRRKRQEKEERGSSEKQEVSSNQVRNWNGATSSNKAYLTVTKQQPNKFFFEL